MAEIKEKFSVKKNKKGDIVITVITTTTVSPYEATAQLKKIQEQIIQNVNKESQLDKQIKNKIAEKELDRCNKKVHALRNLGEKMTLLMDNVKEGHE